MNTGANAIVNAGIGSPHDPENKSGDRQEGQLINALDRERARYHERQSALLARVLRGKPTPGDPDPAT